MLGRIYPPRTTLCGSVHSGGEMCRQVTEQLEDALGLQPRPRPGSPGRVPVPVGPDGAERGHLHEPSPASAPIGSVQRARWRADPESRAPRICVAGRSPLPLNACLELLLAQSASLSLSNSSSTKPVSLPMVCTRAGAAPGGPRAWTNAQLPPSF